MFTKLCFVVLLLMQPKQKSYIRKSADWFSTTTHKHWEEHDLILYFHFLFKLAKTEVLIYRDVDGGSQTYSYKNVFLEFTRGFLMGRPLISSMHSLSTTPLITLPRFPLLSSNRILQVEFLNNTLVHMQLEVLNIGTFKMFKTKF